MAGVYSEHPNSYNHAGSHECQGTATRTSSMALGSQMPHRWQHCALLYHTHCLWPSCYQSAHAMKCLQLSTVSSNGMLHAQPLQHLADHLPGCSPQQPYQLMPDRTVLLLLLLPLLPLQADSLWYNPDSCPSTADKLLIQRLEVETQLVQQQTTNAGSTAELPELDLSAAVVDVTRLSQVPPAFLCPISMQVRRALVACRVVTA